MVGWVSKQELPHVCDPPRIIKPVQGDLWRCDDCYKLWQLYDTEIGWVWYRAWWIARWKYRKLGYPETERVEKLKVKTGRAAIDNPEKYPPPKGD